jgi:hypothetical protein
VEVVTVLDMRKPRSRACQRDLTVIGSRACQRDLTVTGPRSYRLNHEARGRRTGATPSQPDSERSLPISSRAH